MLSKKWQGGGDFPPNPTYLDWVAPKKVRHQLPGAPQFARSYLVEEVVAPGVQEASLSLEAAGLQGGGALQLLQVL